MKQGMMGSMLYAQTLNTMFQNLSISHCEIIHNTICPNYPVSFLDFLPIFTFFPIVGVLIKKYNLIFTAQSIRHWHQCIAYTWYNSEYNTL